MEVGNTATVNATLTPSNSTYKGDIFSSSDENIAKVNPSNGIITGMVPGTVTITATSYDQHKIATCEVTVIPSSNLITNPGFELGEESWDVTGNTSAVTFENDAYKGDKALHYFNGDFEASQTITGLKNGIYSLSAWSQGDSRSFTNQIFAENSNGDRLSADVKNSIPLLDKYVKLSEGVIIGIDTILL